MGREELETVNIDHSFVNIDHSFKECCQVSCLVYVPLLISVFSEEFVGCKERLPPKHGTQRT